MELFWVLAIKTPLVFLFSVLSFMEVIIYSVAFSNGINACKPTFPYKSWDPDNSRMAPCPHSSLIFGNL